MNCIKCGREIPEGEVFCAVCAMPSVAVATPEEPAPKVKKAPRKPKPAAKRMKSGRKLIRRLTVALTAVSILLVGVLALGALEVRDYLGRKEDLRIREAAVTLREKEADRRDARIVELEQKLEQANLTIASLSPSE